MHTSTLNGVINRSPTSICLNMLTKDMIVLPLPFMGPQKIVVTKLKCTIVGIYLHVRQFQGFFSFDINYKDPSVERLSFHLEGEDPIIFEDDDDLEEVTNKPHVRDTKFLAWMEANKKYPKARELTYSEFPLKFTWKEKDHKWSPRQRGVLVRRICYVSPGSGEKFYVQILLNYVKDRTMQSKQ